MSSSQQHQQQQLAVLQQPPSSGSGPRRKGGIKIQQNLQLNKKLHFQPSTALSTTKNNKFSVIRTIERQLESLQNLQTQTQEDEDMHTNGIQTGSHLIKGGGGNYTYDPPSTSSQTRLVNPNQPHRVIHFTAAQSIENSCERNQHAAFKQQHLRSDNENQAARGIIERVQPTMVQLRQPQHANISGGHSKPRHPSRGQSNNPPQPQSNVGNYISGGAGLIYNINTSPMFVQDNSQQNVLQQYSSIPVVNGGYTNTQIKRQTTLAASAGTSSLNTNQADQGHVQLNILNKQASALMKMYGNNGNLYRKQQIKSVERKPHPVVAAAGYTTNYQMYQPQQLTQLQQQITQSNSKLSTSYQLNNMSQRKSIGGNLTLQNYSAVPNTNALQSLNNSVITGSNTLLHQYTAENNLSLHNVASLESHRFKSHGGGGGGIQRNLNQSQTYTKYAAKQSITVEQNSFRKHSQAAARLSTKNVIRSRYNPNSQQRQQPLYAQNGRSIQPLEELRNHFNYEQRVQSTSHALQPHSSSSQIKALQYQQVELQKKKSVNNHKNLLIQQNEILNSSVHQLDSSSDLLNRSAGEDRFRRVTMAKANTLGGVNHGKYQAFIAGQTSSGISGNLSQSTIGSSARRLPVRGVNDFGSSSNNLELTPGGAAATDTVMYLKQQELATKSRELFDEGKSYLLSKDYKEAIKAFTLSLKTFPSNHDSKYYRAICHLDFENAKKCIQDLSELIEADPTYNKTVYIILSIAYRRENDINNSLRSLTKGIQKFPKYIEAYQARGQIHIYLKQFEKALIDFQHVIKLQPQSGAGYIGQADSLKGLGNFKGALQSYNQALQVDERSRSQAIFKRALLYYQLKSLEESLLDFEILLEDNDRNGRAHYYKGKILKKQDLENEAILHFEQVIKNSANNNSDGQSPTRIGPADNNMSSISIPISPQSPGLGSDDQLAGKALFEIAKIRINQKDFYEAFHNLQRAIHYDFKSKKFLQYKMFVEGVLFLMKRKVKKGVKMLTSLLEGTAIYDSKELLNTSSSPTSQLKLTTAIKQRDPPTTIEPSSPAQLKPYLLQLIYVYRSYGLIITSQLDVKYSLTDFILTFQKALSDLNSASKIKKLDEACNYNKYIAQALIKMEKKDLSGVSLILQHAEQKFPSNKDPYKFQAICIVQGVLNDMVDIDNPKKKQAINEARIILDRALEKNPKDINLMYLRGLLLYYTHSFYEALIDLDAVIDLDEEPTAKYYAARGRCHACLSMFQEAISDLTKAIEIDEEISDAYFNRGKCAYLLGDTALAFLDFQKLILLEPKNPMVHIYAGNLLMTTGSYDDATKAFTNADSVQKSSLAYYQRSRCNIALANMDQALKDLNTVVERSPQDKIAYIDKECLSALKSTIVATHFGQNDIVSQNQPSTKNGFDPATFQKAALTYTKLLSAQLEIERNFHSSISAIRQHQQIIPNVKRIKIEKVRALRRKRIKDETFGNGQQKKHRKIKNAFDVKDSTDNQLKAQSSLIEPFSYYKENIFGPEDFYLYRGVMNFYMGDYQKAIVDFEASIKTKQESKDEANDGGDTISSASNQTDLSDVGLCSLNVHESLYNIVLCYILMKDYKQALERVSKLVHESPKRYTKSLYLIRGLLYLALGNNGKSKGDLDIVQKLSSQEAQQSTQQNQASINIYSEFILQKQPISLNPFPIGSRLCSHYPEVKVQIPQAPTYFFSRPSFSFPFVKPPNMIPNVEESVLISEFNLKNTAPPKPEAPWIKRCDFGIKFTDEIQVLENNPSITETEMSTTNKDDEQREDEEEDYTDDDRADQRNRRKKQNDELDEETNERYYLRNYVRQQVHNMVRSYSEQIIVHEIDLFGGNDEELEGQPGEDNVVDSEEESPGQGREDIQNQLRQHLYGATDMANDDGIKNIIIDDEVEEESINGESNQEGRAHNQRSKQRSKQV